MEEYRTRMFENRVLRKIFSPRRGETTRGWRKFCIEFHDMHPCPDLAQEGVMGEISGGKLRNIETAWKIQA
jgi:hypothetical protein